MDGAYFVGRNEILQWINSTLHLHLTKVEEVSVLSIITSPLCPFLGTCVKCSFSASHQTSVTLHGEGLRSTRFLFFPFARYNKQKLLSGSLDFQDARSLASLSHFSTFELQLFFGWHIDSFVSILRFDATFSTSGFVCACLLFCLFYHRHGNRKHS
jgi:hypothetical protein